MKSVETSTAEVLYFRSLHSYLLQKPDLRDNYDMLVDHYTKYPKSLSSLTRNDILRLKLIQDDITNNRYSLFSGTIDFNDNPPEFKKEKSDIKHAELCNGLHKEILENVIGPIKYMSREHPTMFGPVDIVAQSGDTAHVIEVKTSRADHSIVGQVMKYYIALSLRLIIRHYDDVKMITICPGYDKASYFGLKQIGARPFVVNTKTLEISEFFDNNL